MSENKGVNNKNKLNRIRVISGFLSASGIAIQLLACHQGEVGLVLQISNRNIIIPPLPLNGIAQIRTTSNVYALADVGISYAVG